LGMDFLKGNISSNQGININGYYEAQFYMPDFRGQIDLRNRPFITNRTHFTDMPAELLIDPALQITITDPDRRLIFLPFFSGQVR
jgi:hypothetical protein